jgi:hypothetical protein
MEQYTMSGIGKKGRRILPEQIFGRPGQFCFPAAAMTV